MQPWPGCARCLARGLCLLELAARWREGATVSPALPDWVKAGNTYRVEPSLPSGTSVVARGPQCSDRESGRCTKTEGTSGRGSVDVLPGDPGRKPAGPVPPAVSLTHLAARSGQAPTSPSPRSCSRPPGPALPLTGRGSLEEPSSASVSLSRIITPVPPPPRSVSRVSQIIKVNVRENS